MKTTLKALREENKRTIAEIATVLNVSVRAVSRYEQGTRRIGFEDVLTLAKLYGEPTEVIILAQLNSCQQAQVNNQK